MYSLHTVSCPHSPLVGIILRAVIWYQDAEKPIPTIRSSNKNCLVLQILRLRRASITRWGCTRNRDQLRHGCLCLLVSLDWVIFLWSHYGAVRCSPCWRESCTCEVAVHVFPCFFIYCGDLWLFHFSHCFIIISSHRDLHWDDEAKWGSKVLLLYQVGSLHTETQYRTRHGKSVIGKRSDAGHYRQYWWLVLCSHPPFFGCSFHGSDLLTECGMQCINHIWYNTPIN